MRRNFKEYRIHFHPSAALEAIREMIVDILTSMHAHGALPEVLHETAMSKKSALKKSYYLSKRDVVFLEVAKIASERHWPSFARQSYWCEGEVPDDRFVVRFSSNPRSFSWHNMMFIDIPERLAEKFETSVASVRERGDIRFVVIELDPETSEAARALDEKGNWHAKNDRSSSFDKLFSSVITSRPQ